MWQWRESLREWREVVFGSRVRDRVFWFGIEMNTMVMVLNLMEEPRWIKKEKGMKN